MKTLLATIVLLVLATSVYAVPIGGVEFPDGAISFADQVVSFTPGPNTLVPHNNPLEAIGTPNYAGDANYLSLGWGGTLVLRFTNNSLTTSGDADLDLWIFEIGAAVEPTDVSISTDGSGWISVGYVGGATAGVDIDAYIGSGGVTLWEQYSYVMLHDRNQHLSGAPFAGADIDAVGAISSAPPVDPVPEPSTFILLGAGLGGLAFLRRKSAKK